MEAQEDKEPKKRITVLVPISIIEAINIKGKREGRKFSNAVNRVFEEYFKKHKGKQTEEE